MSLFCYLLISLEGSLGYKIKVVERTGSKLKDLFPLTNLWGGSKCVRSDCVTCNQGGEELPDCFRRNLVYESICVKCNPGARNPGPLREPNQDLPSIYVGETSRSIAERSREHWDDFKSMKTDSHIMKHHWTHHQGEGEPEFHFKVVKHFKSALSRQVGEAIRLERRGVSSLNSKGEYSRCKISRLVLEQPVEKESQSMEEVESQRIDYREGEEALLNRRKSWEKGGRKPTIKMGEKRGIEGATEQKGGSKQKKRRKYAPVGANWGVDEPGEMMNLNKTLESSRKIDGPSAPPQPINIVRETLSDRISGTKIEDGEHGHEGDGIERVQDGGGVEHANVLKCEVRKKILQLIQGQNEMKQELFVIRNKQETVPIQQDLVKTPNKRTYAEAASTPTLCSSPNTSPRVP